MEPIFIKKHGIKTFKIGTCNGSIDEYSRNKDYTCAIFTW